MRQSLYLLFLLMFMQINSFAEGPNTGVFKHNWISNPKEPLLNSIIDSTTTPHSMLLETIGDKKGALFISMPFPANDTLSKVEVRINYKTNNCSELYLRVITIGEGEKVNSVDTLHLPLHKEWSNFHQSIDVKSGLFLGLSIDARGFQQEKGQVWIDDFDLFVDGKNVQNYQHKVEFSITEEDIIPLGDGKLDSFPLWDKKILAIGESVHGTETMGMLAIDIIKERITNNNSKLILLELPLEYSLYINRYIDGDPSFKLDSISSYFKSTLYSQSIVTLIDWIREYNLKSNDKVYLIGTDHDFIHLKSRLTLFDFIYTINETANNEELEKLCELLIHSSGSLDDAISKFDANGGFECVLSKHESEILRYCMTLINHNTRSYYNKMNRDVIMFQSTDLLIDKLLNENETVTLFSHLEHLNYRTPLQGMIAVEDFSFGNYMRNKYGNDYSCVGLITETGSYLTSGLSSFTLAELKPSPIGSLEYLINKQNIDRCYLSMTNFTFSDMLQTRSIGNRQLEKEFYYMIPKARIDGVIFIKESAAILKDKDAFEKNRNMNVLIMNSFSRALRKMKKL